MFYIFAVLILLVGCVDKSVIKDTDVILPLTQTPVQEDIATTTPVVEISPTEPPDVTQAPSGTGSVTGTPEPVSLTEVPCVGIRYLDYDQDGYGDASRFIDCHEATDLWVENSQDCQDLEPDVFPGGTEYCDGLDNDCDGIVDEDLADFVWWEDQDLDGYGSETESTISCQNLTGWSRLSGDCDDSDPNVYRDAEEIPDGLDNNCNGLADEGL